MSTTPAMQIQAYENWKKYIIDNRPISSLRYVSIKEAINNLFNDNMLDKNQANALMTLLNESVDRSTNQTGILPQSNITPVKAPAGSPLANINLPKTPVQIVQEFYNNNKGMILTVSALAVIVLLIMASKEVRQWLPKEKRQVS